MPDQRALLARVRKWGGLWGVPDLAEGMTIEFSARMRRTLGRCRPERSQIRLADSLRAGSPALLNEVLCHEAAHVAAHRLMRGGAEPHGKAWRQLVAQAGFVPRIRAAGSTRSARARPELTHVVYHHRCPVCQNVRLARRPVSSWRCADCVAAGLPGELVVARRAPIWHFGE